MMTILDRYIIKRQIALGVFGLIVFTIAWLAPEIMFKAMQGFSQHKLTLTQAVAYLLYQLPTVMSYCLPITSLFSSVFLFRQLSLSLELTAIQASGISFKRLLIPVGIVGSLFMVLFILNQEVALPNATKALELLTRTTHFDEEENQPNPYVTFVERDKNKVISKLMIVLPHAKPEQSQFVFLFYRLFADGNVGIHRMVAAQQGHWVPKRHQWLLQQGWYYSMSPDGIFREAAPFKAAWVSTTDIMAELLALPHSKPPEMSVDQLHRYVALLDRGEQKEDARFFGVRLWQRYTVPLVTLIFALVGSALGIERTRTRRHFGLMYSALIILLYNVMLSIATTVGSMGHLPLFIAALVPPIAATAVGYGFIQLRRREG